MRLHRILSLTLGLLALGSVAQAQHFRLEVGGAASNIKLSDDVAEQAKKASLGLRVAAAYEHNILSKYVYLSPGIVWRKGGASLADAAKSAWGDLTQGAGSTADLGLPSLETESFSIPLMLGLRIKPGNIIGLSVEAGPYLNYTYKMREVLNGKAVDLLASLGASFKDKLNYGLGVSAALELTVITVRVGLETSLSERLQWRELKGREYNAYASVGIRI